MVSSAYLRLLIFLPAILFPAYASSSLAFCMMYSAYKLNKQGDNKQIWHTPIQIWNQFIVPCLVLTVVSWPAYRFVRSQVRWSGIPISENFSVCCNPHSLQCSLFSRNRHFLEFSCFFYDPTDVGNLVSGSFAFSKCRLYILNLFNHRLLKPSLNHFELYLVSMWNECNCAVVWTFFGIALL